ncbi:VanZ like family protein [Desulfonema limicola]|uniref:VanZ like family protein n=2 Tax=Desulfonema limicola TaxID=45656 RepID=A0A975BDG9_9BACT|nr:VanZ like family protein [Desulfonema limicola]
MDKILHFGGYAFLGALFFRAFNASLPDSKIKTIIFISITTSVLYGLTDELHQSFTTSRSADIMDFAADTAGSIFGVLTYCLVSSKISFFIQKKAKITKKSLRTNP